jgi:hypothetical protein
MRKELDETPMKEHASKISELQKEISPWHELSDSERRTFVERWKKKMVMGKRDRHTVK